MRTWWVGVALFAAVQSFGCNDSDEENCKTMCEWSDDCGESETDPGCTDDCIANMKQADEACSDALDDFADCVEIHECEDECGVEAAALLADCVEYFD
jgi:hypothetical protein